jgi:ribose/xylose/arabinose/galactoside ABC-type transport system permease subunit
VNAISPSSKVGSKVEGSNQSLLRRVLLAQESGLILVIALLMAALTLFGGTKPLSERRTLAETTIVTTSKESDGDEVIKVTTGDKSEWYNSEDGYEYRGSGAGGTLLRKTQINKFLNIENLVLQLVYASYIAVMAVGMTAVIVMGGIDLSVGSIYAVAALFGAMSLHWLQAKALGVPYDGAVTSEGGASLLTALPLCLTVCCGVGALCGLLNGGMIVGLRVHPFIITLGTMAALRGLVAIPTKAQSVGNFPESLTRGFFKMDVAGTNPVPPLIMIATAAIGAFVLSRTVLGRRVYAIGGNEVASGYAGIPVGRVKIIIHTIMGALAGLSAAIYLGYLGAAETAAGSGYELKVIAATVIGGASLSGGRGTAFGAVLGALLVQFIENGMLILNINQNYNQIVMGGAIIAAVVLDQMKSRLMPRGR